jgi:hypothetical protein
MTAHVGIALSVAVLLLAGDAGGDDGKPPGPAPVRPRLVPSAPTPEMPGRRRRRCSPVNREQCGNKAIGPIIATNTAADLVLGQPTFTSDVENQGGLSASTLSRPTGLAGDSGGLIVADTANNRALVWAPAPKQMQQAASLVLVQPSPASAEPNRLAVPQGVAVTRDKIVVSQEHNHRVVIFERRAPHRPLIVLGQPDSKAAAPGRGLNQMANPGHVWTDGTVLIVADRGNYRVLIWKTFPTTNGQPAELVLGESGSPGSALNQLKMPQGLHYDGNRLWVADATNHRVLVWNQALSLASGAPASFQVGSGVAQATATGLNAPRGVTVHDGALFVSDTGNHRVLVWDTLPTAATTPASHVLGQDNLTTANLYPPSERSVIPHGLVVTGDNLWVVDGGRHRILRFRLYP